MGMGMLPLIVMRTILGAFTLAIISFLTFVIIQLPEGDRCRYIEMPAGGRRDQPAGGGRHSRLLGLNRPCSSSIGSGFLASYFKLTLAFLSPASALLRSY